MPIPEDDEDPSWSWYEELWFQENIPVPEPGLDPAWRLKCETAKRFELLTRTLAAVLREAFQAGRFAFLGPVGTPEHYFRATREEIDRIADDFQVQGRRYLADVRQAVRRACPSADLSDYWDEDTRQMAADGPESGPEF